MISGRVQGVGFRPAVYGIADKLGLCGFIYNDTKGVTIELQGQVEKISDFKVRLRGSDKPPLAEIKTLESVEIAAVEGEQGFVIRTSKSEGSALSQVTADMAVCEDCLSEMLDKGDFRFRYPFINCTNCGPRYSIVKTIPYDRCNTTMSVFEMCKKCGGQYENVTDRRFHAQPVACGDCGPKIRLVDTEGKTISTESDEVISKTALLLSEGKIAAIKGVGGYHLAVDALNKEAVGRLRERKRRDHKPFAMMAASVEKIKEYTIVSEEADKILRSPQSPIVLLPKKKGCGIAEGVAEEVSTYGFMLCYAPLHYLLFAEGPEVLVMTSGNISDEPLICKDDKALEKLGDVADVFLMHDREIYRQVDDSVVHIIDGEAVLLRRSRGYVPSPIFIEEDCREEIFAAGGDMKNAFCFGKSNQLICSEHIGDMEDAEVYHHYVNSVEHLRKLFEVEPKVAVCDLHPGYFSTRYALSLKGVKLIQVQHHWAHTASVLAEHGLDGPVIGLSVDGTGYGTDGAIWGCECLIASLTNFERFGHLAYYSLAGADKASKEAIRPVLGLLKQSYGEKFELENFRWLLEQIEPDLNKQRIIAEQLGKKVNTVETSSLGRVFDAVAAMAGLGSYNDFEAQLPMALESVAADAIEESYEFGLTSSENESVQIDFCKMIQQIIGDIERGTARETISAKFHNCLCEALLGISKEAKKKSGLKTVALSGGVFCNRYLTNRLIKLLKKNDFIVLFNREIPSNDGGVSIGQAAIAITRR